MGAYENPAIIRDTSGQIYGQAIASFGQSIAKGISIYGQKAQEAKKRAPKSHYHRSIACFGITSPKIT